MDSLTTDPVAAVLRRLYQEAARADRPLMERYRDRDVALDELLKAEAKDYRALYRTYADNFLNVSADFGRFLYICARARQAKRIVEFGTSFGISTIHLACALRDGGGGHLIGSELEPTKARRAQENLNDAGLADLVEIRVGDIDEIAIRSDVRGCGKKAEPGVFDHFVASRAIFPDRAVGSSVTFGDIEELLVRGDGDAVWAVDVSRHQAGARLILDLRPFGTEVQENDLVGGFADYVDKVVLLGGFTGWTYALR